MLRRFVRRFRRSQDTLERPAIDDVRGGLLLVGLSPLQKVRARLVDRRLLRRNQWRSAALVAAPTNAALFSIVEADGTMGGAPFTDLPAHRTIVEGFVGLLDSEVELAGPDGEWFVLRAAVPGPTASPVSRVVLRAVFDPRDWRYRPRARKVGGALTGVDSYSTLMASRLRDDAARRPDDPVALFRYGRYLAETKRGGERLRGLDLIERAIELDRGNTRFVRTWLSLARPRSAEERAKAENYRERVRESWM